MESRDICLIADRCISDLNALDNKTQLTYALLNAIVPAPCSSCQLPMCNVLRMCISTMWVALRYRLNPAAHPTVLASDCLELHCLTSSVDLAHAQTCPSSHSHTQPHALVYITCNKLEVHLSTTVHEHANIFKVSLSTHTLESPERHRHSNCIVKSCRPQSNPIQGHTTTPALLCLLTVQHEGCGARRLCCMPTLNAPHATTASNKFQV